MRIFGTCILVVYFSVGLRIASGADSRETADRAPEFAPIFAEWKDVLSEMRQLQSKYQLGSDADRPAIEKQFNQHIEKARQMAPRVASAAERAFVQSPNQEKQVRDFLVSTVLDDLRHDDYEEALRLAHVLIENKVNDESIYELAGIAAFNSNHFAESKKYLEDAVARKLIGDSGKGLLKQADHYVGLWDKENTLREAEAKADDLPRVKLATSKGDIVLELFENEAPIATANFISLVDKGFYNGLKFHRVLPGFMAQGGDPKGNGTGGPGYTIPCECYKENYRHHFRGSLSMAHAGRDTGGSQFFLTFVPTPNLDGKHTVFGRIIDGFGVLAKLQRIDPSQSVQQAAPDRIVTATVLRKRNHEYEPVKGPEKP